MLKTRAIPVLLPRVPPRSSPVLLDGLTDDEALDLGLITLTMIVTHIRQYVHSELNTDQGKRQKEHSKICG